MKPSLLFLFAIPPASILTAAIAVASTDTEPRPFTFPAHMPLPVSTSADHWEPIRMPFLDPGPVDIDLSSLVERPAGQHGFLTASPDGHFRFADGTRARFWGVAIQDSIVAPSKKHAEQFADNLAKHGCNLVRLHIFDYYLRGALEEPPDRRTPANTEKLDRFDYLIYCLKECGIYVYMDLNDTMSKWWGVQKGTDIWDDGLIAKQEDFARRLFTRVNPYTGNRYTDEPAVSHVEIINESSFWWNDNVLSEKEPRRAALQSRWNDWLAHRYPDDAALRHAWRKRGTPLPPDGTTLAGRDIPLQSVHANEDFSRFCYELTVSYYRRIYSFLRDELGVKVPITGHNSPFATPDLKAVAEVTDFTSTHFYWTMSTDIHLDRPLEDFWTFLPQLAASKVKGKPLLVTEFNFCAPNPYRAESVPVLVSSLLSQDVDGVIFFNYLAQSGGASFEKLPKSLWNFRFLPNDPTIWGQFDWGAIAFHRQYIKPIPDTATVSYDDSETFQLERIPSTLSTEEKKEVRELSKQYEWRHVLATDADFYNQLPGMFRSPEKRWPYLVFPYGWRVERQFSASPSIKVGNREFPFDSFQANNLKPSDILNSSTNGDAYQWIVKHANGGPEKLARQAAMFSAGRLGPDDGQWYRKTNEPFLVVNTPFLQGGVGKWDADSPLVLADFELSIKTPWASVFLCSLDDRPLHDSKRILLTAVGSAVNTDQDPPDQDWETAGKGRGRGPILFSPVIGQVLLRNSHGRFRIWSINPEMGIRGNKEVKVRPSPLGTIVDIGKERAIQFIIEQ